MHAISVQQPWSWAILRGGKSPENRRNKRGLVAAKAMFNKPGARVALHAGQRYAGQEAYRVVEHLSAVDPGDPGMPKSDTAWEFGAFNSSLEPTSVPANVQASRDGLRLIAVGPPRGISDEDCGTVESLVGQIAGYPAFTSYWKPTPQQLELLNAGGVIELVQYTAQMVMHSMSIWPAVDEEELATALGLRSEADQLAAQGRCPVGCGRSLPDGKVTCGPCWRKVPKHLQREVYAAWRALSNDLTGETIRRHRDAKNAAIGSIG